MTDSIFLTIPIKNLSEIKLEDKWKIADKVATNINKMIASYYNDYLLPRQNINISHNTVNFKTEFVMEYILFLDIKKHYAYKIIITEGKIMNPPIIEYKGIPIVRTNVAKLTQKILKTLIEDVVLNPNISNNDKFKNAEEVYIKFYNQFNENINDLIFDDVSIPVKWNKQNNVIESMKLFNFLMDEEIFTSGSSGKSVYCKFLNYQYLLAESKNKFDLSIIKTITFPHNYDQEKFNNALKQYGIVIDINKQWDTIFNKICKRTIDLIKLSYCK